MKLFSMATCRMTGGLFYILLLSGCASTPQSDRLLQDPPTELVKPVELTDTPFFPQTRYQCGPAALATLLQDQDVKVTPGELTDQVYIPARKGSLQIEMVATTRRHGLIPYLLPGQLDVLLEEIRHGRPVLVLQNLGMSWYPAWHYAVVVGYDLQDELLILRSGTTRRYRVSLHTFERTWQRSRNWAMIALPPGQLPVRPDEWRYMKAVAGFEQIRNWKALEKAYAAGLSQWPESRDLHMGYGNSRYVQGDLSKARQEYQVVVERYPDFAPAHNNLAQVLAELGEYQQALLHVQRAITLGGTHSEQYQATLREIQALIDSR